MRTVVLGERMRILKRTSATASEAPGWALVQCLDGRLGWISESWLALKNDMAFVSWNRQNAAVMRRPNTELRPENGDALVFAGAGIQLYQLEHQADYWEVLLPDGRKAKAAGTALEDVSAWQQREEELRRSSPSAYLKALAASDNEVPFYVAAPSSTIDWTLNDGKREIPIENRAASELLVVNGIGSDGTVRSVQIAASDVAVTNPAFDVTHNRFVTGIITERGIVKPTDLVTVFADLLPKG